MSGWSGEFMSGGGGVNVTKQNVPIRGAILVRHFGVNNVIHIY